MTTGVPAVFLDRDGVLIEDTGYPHLDRTTPPDPRRGEGRAPAERRAAICASIVTNQSGVARGLFTEDQMNAFNALVVEPAGGEAGRRSPRSTPAPSTPRAVVEAYIHPDHPDRKPNPGMILRAIADHGIDPARSFMIGDQPIATWRRRAARACPASCSRAAIWTSSSASFWARRPRRWDFPPDEIGFVRMTPTYADRRWTSADGLSLYARDYAAAAGRGEAAGHRHPRPDPQLCRLRRHRAADRRRAAAGCWRSTCAGAGARTARRDPMTYQPADLCPGRAGADEPDRHRARRLPRHLHGRADHHGPGRHALEGHRRRHPQRRRAGGGEGGADADRRLFRPAGRHARPGPRPPPMRNDQRGRLPALQPTPTGTPSPAASSATDRRARRC